MDNPGLSRLIEQIVNGDETEVTISRHGQTVARLVPIPRTDSAKRIGIAACLFEVRDTIDAHNADILNLTIGA